MISKLSALLKVASLIVSVLAAPFGVVWPVFEIRLDVSN